MADLDSGRPEPTAERVARLLDALGPTARRLGCSAELANAYVLLDAGGEAARQRAVGVQSGARALAAWLAERFVGEEEPPPRPPALSSAADDRRAPQSLRP
jgi:gamma-glutamyl:cysteine ligase YbdK (ATP-grasp superfamily)